MADEARSTRQCEHGYDLLDELGNGCITCHQDEVERLRIEKARAADVALRLVAWADAGNAIDSELYYAAKAVVTAEASALGALVVRAEEGRARAAALSDAEREALEWLDDMAVAGSASSVLAEAARHALRELAERRARDVDGQGQEQAR